MKILALRIRNLTSLSGSVEIDFQAPPLAQAGLFAITGPTGAGKSTLLDALCLALYDTLPRLGYGEDVRSVLRHGATDASAEVDFQGRDGGHYRARWEVRRARNRPDGKVQPQTLSLLDLSNNAVLGGGKRETQDAIRDKVGLDYQQFRRSVLLAQNDFDAFLRAKPAERADLLELMTGTDIYGRLSMAAFERAKQHEAALRLLEEDLQRVNVLADDDRQALHHQAEDAQSHTDRLAVQYQALTQESQWHRTAQDLAARTQQARQQAALAQTAWDEAQPDRQHLDQVRRALTVVPQVAEMDRLAAEHRRLTDQCGQIRQQVAELEQTAQAAQQACDLARQADEQAEAAFKAAGPDLDRAADLDARLADGQARLQRSRTTVEQSQALAEQADSNLRHLAADLNATRHHLHGVEAWLEQHTPYRPLAEQSDRWLDALAAYAAAQSDRHAARQQMQTLGQQTAALAQTQAEDQQAAQTIRQQLDQVDQAIAQLDRRLDSQWVSGIEQQRDRLTTVHHALERLADVAAAFAHLRQRQQDIQQRRQDASRQLTQTEQQRQDLDSQLRTVAAALPEAQSALDLAEAADSKQAALLRQRLLDGQPCPVCGATEHPGRIDHSPLTALLDSQRVRVGQLQTQRDNLMAGLARCTAQTAAATSSLHHADTDAATLNTEQDGLLHQWQQITDEIGQSAAALDLPAARLAEQPSLDDALRSLRDACDDRMAAIAAQMDGIRADHTQRHTLQIQRDALYRQDQQISSRQSRAAHDLATQRAQMQAADQIVARATADMQRQRDMLAAPLACFDDWQDRLADPAQLERHIRQWAQQWQDRQTARQQGQQAERSMASKHDSAVAALDNARRTLTRERDVLRDEQTAQDRLYAERAKLFDGQPTADVRTRLNEARKTGKTALFQAQDRWAAAKQDHHIALSQLHGLDAALAETTDREAAARQALEQTLADNGQDLTAIRQAMGLGAEWISQAEARQAELSEHNAAARAILAERQQAETDHQAQATPQHSAAQLEQLLPQHGAELDAARQSLSDLQRRLAEDDRNRHAAQDTRQRIAAQRTIHDLWKGMTDLIGSADGKKFRLFAQGLTLDRLLEQANRHLSDLTPRYGLRRTPGSDLDLQVIDHDMADETRNVANLSGGERFLLSLSLALGLASMTGSHTLAESLFIDEGFGALDAESLDMAIGALETLQSTGRKVGIISHVQAMIDRIGTQIRITKLGGGRSRLEIRGLG